MNDSKFASAWIRDGVLINRMHVNPVAFAYSYWLFAETSKRKDLQLEDLVNFGFAKSGVSCNEKMLAYNLERVDALQDVHTASQFYNQLATAVGATCSYFPGAVNLLADLKSAGGSNFITSAVEQPVLDDWKRTKQGDQIAKSLSEILGSRTNFSKGRDHFERMAHCVGNKPIYYVADAVAEIDTASRFSEEFNIVPIGFGFQITDDHVIVAGDLVHSMVVTMCQGFPRQNHVPELPMIKRELLRLADATQIEEQLLGAGAKYVAVGNLDEIYVGLRQILAKLSVFKN